MPPSNRREEFNTPDCPVRCLSYTHHQRYFSSDHKPVSGVFDVFVPYGRLLDGTPMRSRLWPRGPIGSRMQGRRRPSGPPPHIALTEGGMDVSLRDDVTTGDRHPPMCAPESPSLLPTVADVDLLGGGVPALLPDPAYRPPKPPAEHEQEVNLLSLPGSPRDLVAATSTAERGAPAVRVLDRGSSKPQESGARSNERTPSAIDELDALLSSIHVQAQQESRPSDWTLLDVSHPPATAPPEEGPIDSMRAQEAESAGGTGKPVDLTDLLS